MAAFINRLHTPGQDLEDADYQRALAWTFRQLNVWIAATYAYENGIAPERTYENIRENIRNEISGAI